MIRYRTLGTLNIGAGTVLKLTPAQAAPRAHNLKDLGGGQYEALVVLQFKTGETLGVEGSLPKAHQHLVETVDGEKREKTTSKASAKAADLLSA